MRFRESPPNSRLTTLYCILHPAICISHKVLAQVEVGESIDLVRVSSLVLLHQYPFARMLVRLRCFCPCRDTLPVVILAWPPAPDRRAVDLPETQALVPGPNKGGWTPILLCYTPAVRNSNDNAAEPAAIEKGPAALFARVRVLAVLGDDSAAGGGRWVEAVWRQWGELASWPIALALQQGWPVESIWRTVWAGHFCCF